MSEINSEQWQELVRVLVAAGFDEERAGQLAGLNASVVELANGRWIVRDEQWRVVAETSIPSVWQD